MDKAFNLVVFLGLFFLIISVVVAGMGKPNQDKFVAGMVISSFACGLLMSILIIKILTD
jgi:hypothetical protein